MGDTPGTGPAPPTAASAADLAALLRQLGDSCACVRILSRMIAGADLSDRDALRATAVEHERARAADLLVRYRRAHDRHLRSITSEVLS